MKLLSVLLTAAWVMLAATTAADAGPIAAAIGAVAGLLKAGGLVGFLVKTALSLALNFAGSLISKAMAPKEEPRGVNLQIQMGDDKPAGIIIGKYATAGRRKYIGTWGNDGKTPNAFVTDVIEICNMPNRAGPRGIVSLWVDDTMVEVLWGEPDPEGRGFPVKEYRTNKDHLWIRFLDGTQREADPFLLDKFGGHPDRPFLSSMVGRGCQVLILTARYDSEGLFTNGLPQVVVEPVPLPIYDPRKDGSAGGSGGHRWGDASTYQWTENNAVIIYNLIRGLYYEGEWVFGGQNLGAHRLPSSSWFAAMNECDRQINQAGGGTAPQFRGGYELLSDQEPLDVIEKFRLGCSGRVTENGGMFKMLVGAPGAAVYSFTDDDIVITQGQNFDPFPTIDDTFNAIEATYPEPRERWVMKDAQRQDDEAMRASDGGKNLPFSVAFEAVPFATQVQVLTRTMLKDGRRFRVHQFVLPPDARPLEPNDVVAWSSRRNGYIDKDFIVEGKDNLPNLCAAVTLREMDPTDYDWSKLFERPVSIGWLGPIRPDAQPMSGWTVEPAIIYDSSGNPRRPSIRVGCDDDLDDVRNVWVQVRHFATGQVIFDSDSTPYADPYSWLIDAPFLPKEVYEARGRYVPYSTRPTEWSAWFRVTTPDVRLGEFDVYLPGMVEEITQQIGEFNEFATTGAREALERFRALVLDEGNEAAANYTDRKLIREETELKIGQTRAYVSESLELAVGPKSALIKRIDNLRVEVDEGFAQVAETLTLSIGPNGSVIKRIDDLQVEYDEAITGLNEAILSSVGPNGSITGRLSTMTAKYDKGLADVNDLVETEVSRVDGRITAQAQTISSLSSEVDGVAASITVRAQTTASGQSGVSRYVVQAKAGADTFVSSSLFLEVSNGVGSAGVIADRFYIANPASPGQKFSPFVVQGGTLRANAAVLSSLIVGDIEADQLKANSIAARELLIDGIPASRLGYGSHTAVAAAAGSGGTSGGQVLLASLTIYMSDNGTIIAIPTGTMRVFEDLGTSARARFKVDIDGIEGFTRNVGVGNHTIALYGVLTSYSGGAVARFEGAVYAIGSKKT